MKIKVFSRGTTDIDADAEYQEPAIREAIEDGCNDVGSQIVDYTDNERSDISHDEYAIVTKDDGTELWRGWLTGNPDAAAPAEAAGGGKNHAGRPRVVCLCGSTRFYDEFQQANYDLTMQGVIVLSVGFYPHAKAQHGHGEEVGHDSAEKAALDELHKRKIDLADEVLVVSDESGYFGMSTASEIRYAVLHGKTVRFAEPAAEARAGRAGL